MKSKVDAIKIERLIEKKAGIDYSHGIIKRAYLNPAVPLYYIKFSNHTCWTIMWLMQGITILLSENGSRNNPAAAIPARPGGYRNNNNGNYNNMGNNGYFWSATANNSDNAWKRNLNYNNSEVNRNNNNNRNGFSVRLLRYLNLFLSVFHVFNQNKKFGY